MQENPRTFQAKLVAQRGGRLVYHFTAKDITDRICWYIIALNQPNSDAFLHALQKQKTTIELGDYGEVLASGIGDEVPEAILEEIRA